MSTTQSRKTYSDPKFSIRKEDGVYSGPLFAVTPGGVPVREYPKFVEPTDNQQDARQQSSPPVPNAPPVRLPVFNTDAASSVEAPPAPVSQSPYNAQEAVDQNFNKLLTAHPEDQNGRLKSSLYGLAAPVAPSDSLGRLIGERLANAANYALNPKLDEEAAQKEEIAKQLTIRKIQQDRDEAQAAINLKNAQATNQESLPVFRTKQEQDRATQAAQTAGYHTISSLEREYRARPVYDPTDAAETSDPNSLTNRAARGGITFSAKNPRMGKGGMQVGDTRYEYDLNGNLQPATAGGKVLVDASKTVGEDGLTNEQRAQQNDRQEALRVKTQIADEFAGIQRERNTLSQDQFKQKQVEFQTKYPGYGKPPVKKSELDALQQTENQRALKYGGRPRDARQDAINKGYEIDETQ